MSDVPAVSAGPGDLARSIEFEADDVEIMREELEKLKAEQIYDDFKTSIHGGAVEISEFFEQEDLANVVPWIPADTRMYCQEAGGEREIEEVWYHKVPRYLCFDRA